MEKDTENIGFILGKVISMNQQREQFYLHESKEIADEELRELFRVLALQSASFNQLLQNDLSNPEAKINAHSTSISDWNEARPSSSLVNLKSVLAASESLEAYAEKIYFEALSCKLPLDMNLRKLISNQHYEIKRAYKKIKELRNSVTTN